MSNSETCSKCDQTKTLDHFPKKGGKWCKLCRNAYERERRGKKRDHQNKIERERYAKKKQKLENATLEVDLTTLIQCTGEGCKGEPMKPLSEFYFHKSKGTFRSECKKCHNDRRKIHYKENKEYVKKQVYEYQKNKLKTDPVYKFEKNLRTRVYQAFTAQNQKKKQRTRKYLDCTTKFFQEWICFQLYDGMTLENYGDWWHIDHVKPCAKFDLSDEIQAKECFHWSNCRPYLRTKNNEKYDHFDPREVMLQEMKAKVFQQKWDDGEIQFTKRLIIPQEQLETPVKKAPLTPQPELQQTTETTKNQTVIEGDKTLIDCRSCLKMKSTDAFCKNKNMKRGFQSWCKECTNEYKQKKRKAATNTVDRAEFPCPYCPKTYHLKDSKRRHIRQKHPSKIDEKSEPNRTSKNDNKKVKVI